MFESQQNLMLMIVEIILSENYCIMITKIKLNVKHSEITER